MIIVTGANGKLGRGVVDGLLERVAPDQIVACVRDPGKAGALAGRGVAVRHGDFAAPNTLAAAFAGARQVLITSVDCFGAEARALHRTAIEAAATAGASRILYTSHMGARPDSAFADHCAAEDDLAASSTAFTSLRHGFYAESAFHLIGRGFEAGEIRAPEDGPVSWTARADLAQADAVVLALEGRLNGVSPPLTAMEAFTMADLAAIASEATGRTIKRTVVADAQWVDEQTAQGLPTHLAHALLAMYRAARRGELAATDPLLGTLLGRTPQTMRDVLMSTLGPRSHAA